MISRVIRAIAAPAPRFDKMKLFCLFCHLLLGALAACHAGVAISPADSAPLRFAAEEIERAARDVRRSVPEVTMSVEAGAAQSYRIERDGPRLRVIGGDAAGAMYGGLDVAEAVRIGALEQLAVGERRPHIEFRGIKFNIPLDVRTPSYSDNASAAQANIPEMWSRAFWAEFLDEMARHRFNVLSLWSLNPFPSIVRVPEFPDVALDDVLRARPEHFDENFSHRGGDMFRPAMLAGAEVVRRMSIDEKIAFWREVMQMAKDRGVGVYWFTWNTFLNGAEGKNGLSRAREDESMIRYFRASVRETVKTYPLLAGMGITAGEEMGERMAGRTKEQWLWQTYGEGVRDGLRDTPGRPFRMIHRFHETGINEIRAEWRDYPGVLDYSYKYAVAHMYASTRPKFIDGLLGVFPRDQRTWLTVRNDDIYSFRWADPAFARAFIAQMPGGDVVRGFYMGPDGYCWGRDFISKPDGEGPPPLVLRKQWFSFMLWGRLSYDPTLADAHFQRVLAAHFPGVPADRLLAAWSAASRVFPEITRFLWGNIDLKWLPEANISHPRHKGFYTVRHYVEGETMPGEKNISIREWRDRLGKRAPLDGVVTPPQVAANLRGYADEALAGATAIAGQKSEAPISGELAATLGDITAFAHIGRYYAAKIEAACELALFDSTGSPGHQHASIERLAEALGHWRAYAAAYTKQYRQPLLYNRVGWVDVSKLAEKAAADIDIARDWKPGSVKYSPTGAKGRGGIFGQ